MIRVASMTVAGVPTIAGAASNGRSSPRLVLLRDLHADRARGAGRVLARPAIDSLDHDRKPRKLFRDGLGSCRNALHKGALDEKLRRLSGREPTVKRNRAGSL